jgi:aspartate racemase
MPVTIFAAAPEAHNHSTMDRRQLLKLGLLSGASVALPACQKAARAQLPATPKMKTLGLIGGTSWHSTIDYYRYINQMVTDRLGDPPTNPPLLMYSLCVDMLRRGDWDEINEAFLAIALNLQQAGADAILICANTTHKVYPFVAPKLDIPIIHIADAIGEEAQQLGINNLGLLGTQMVTEENFIRDRLNQEYQIQVNTPDQPNRAKMSQLIFEELTSGIFRDTTKQYMPEEMAKLKTQGADGIILGCTELPILVKSEDFDLPLLDTTYSILGG